MIIYQYKKVSADAPCSDDALAALPSFFASRIKNKKSPSARAESLAGAEILLELLHESGVSPSSLEFDTDKNGRPCAAFHDENKDKNMLPIDFFNESDSSSEKKRSAARKIDFNISHSQCIAVAVLATGEGARVGVDVEKIGRASEEKLAERWFSPRERTFLAESEDKSLAFTRIWTRKESMLKYIGIGIGSGFSDADTFSPPENTEFTEKLLPDGYVITICHRTGEKPSEI